MYGGPGNLFSRDGSGPPFPNAAFGVPRPRSGQSGAGKSCAPYAGPMIYIAACRIGARTLPYSARSSMEFVLVVFSVHGYSVDFIESCVSEIFPSPFLGSELVIIAHPVGQKRHFPCTGVLQLGVRNPPTPVPSSQGSSLTLARPAPSLGNIYRRQYREPGIRNSYPPRSRQDGP